MKNNFLLEIGCEEIPSHAQRNLSRALKELFSQNLNENKLQFDDIKTFSTPRRLAVLIFGLDAQQASQTFERQGPPLQDAYDKNGTPTLVCIGFAKSCGVSVDELQVKETPKGKRLVCLCEKPGDETKNILPEIIKRVISKLPITKPMRWGNKTESFIRPVHWLVALLGDQVLSLQLFGLTAGRETQGHRFLHPEKIIISKPEDYTMLLYTQGFVIADDAARREVIRKSILSSVPTSQKVLLNENLLEEVTGLVEWPVVLKGAFDRDFLSVPKECLITAMQTHQKCFPITNEQHELQPNFILVSNIVSKNPTAVIHGNERVIRARLSDAKFFYTQDCKTTLEDRLPKLNHIVFQEHLGSLHDKTNRIIKLAAYIAKKIKCDLVTTKRAARLSKCDLVTDMVSEFPNLQGIMGYYYAMQDKESEDCAKAIAEQYYPRFSGDQLPQSDIGSCLALADRIDTVVGVLGINKTPTGDKDPFGLRRAALGVIRILVEKNIDLDLKELLHESKKLYEKLPNKNVEVESYDFMMARLKSWYLDRSISPEVFESVMACDPASPCDFNRRIQAVLQFQQLPEASSLAAANKRVNNILKKQDKKEFKKTNSALFEFEAEKILSEKLSKKETIVNALYNKAEYEKALTELSTLKEPIDQFFDSVMIMVDDEKKKQNRLALLSSIRSLFTKVADISLL